MAKSWLRPTRKDLIMSDEYDDAPEPQDGTDLVPRAHIKELERLAKEGKEAKERLAGLERENAFAKALGTAMSEPWAGYFQKGYEGDLAPEAIREAATVAGFARGPEPSAPASASSEPASNQDLAAIQRLSQVQAGAAPAPPFDPATEIMNAKSQDEIMAIIAKCDPDKHGVSVPGPQ
jgi:hypothetical protein